MDMNANTQEQEQYPDMDPNVVQEESPDEPLGTQILRRVHQDSIILLEEYDEMITLLEHPKVKKFMLKKLERLAQDLDEIEGMFQEHYAEMQGLEGISDMESTSPEEGVVDPGQALDDKEISNAATDAAPADSQELPVPTPEEAVEGMKRPSRNTMTGQKTLRSKKKSMCPGCGNDPCTCAEKKSISNQEQRGRNLAEIAKDPKHAPYISDLDGSRQGSSTGGAVPPDDKWKFPDRAMMGGSGIAGKEKRIGEAVAFLKQLGEKGFNLDHESKLKSFHYHKILEEEGKAYPESDDMTPEREQARVRRDPLMGEVYERERDRNLIMSPNQYEHIRPMDATEIARQDKYNLAGEIQSMYPNTYRVENPNRKNMDGGMMPEGMDVEMKNPYQKACHAASQFLKCMSSEKAFGDPHRAEALFHGDSLASTWSQMKKEAHIAQGSDKEAAKTKQLVKEVSGEIQEKAANSSVEMAHNGKGLDQSENKAWLEQLTKTILGRESQLDLLTKKIEKLKL